MPNVKHAKGLVHFLPIWGIPGLAAMALAHVYPVVSILILIPLFAVDFELRKPRRWWHTQLRQLALIALAGSVAGAGIGALLYLEGF
jgi:hypothetical protein